MNVLQVIPSYYPAEVYGGTVRIAHDLSLELVKRGHNVTVYTGDSLGKHSRIYPRYAEIDGVKVHYFRYLSNGLAWHRLGINPGIIPQLRKEAKSFDIFQLHGLRHFDNIVAQSYAMKYRIPYVLLTGGSVLPISGKVSLKKAFDRLFGYRILRQAARVIVATEFESAEHKKMGVRDDQIVVIPASYDIALYSHLPPTGLFKKKYGISEKHIVMFLGRLNKIKGIDFLIEAFSRLAAEREDVKLVLVGPDDGIKEALEKQIENLKLGKRVLFTGFLAGEDKFQALVDADMLVQTSLFERAPGSPFEAILCNIPIIVTRNTGCGLFVSKVDAGYVVDYGDTADLLDKMRNIIADPREAMAKTRKAKQYIINNLSWGKLIEDYEQLYLSLIQKKASA